MSARGFICLYTASLVNASQYEVLPPLRSIEWFCMSAEKQIRMDLRVSR